MRELNEVFAALSKSVFRCKFHLQAKDVAYINEKGMPTVIEHARNFISKRIKPAEPVNDGKQTPFRGHPIFVAQHATACCCRGCLEKWHRIPKGRLLTSDEEAHIVNVLERWLFEEMGRLL